MVVKGIDFHDDSSADHVTDLVRQVETLAQMVGMRFVVDETKATDFRRQLGRCS